MPDAVVIDASAMVDALAGTPLAPAVIGRLRGCALHAPAHFDAEVMSALGRLHRGGKLSDRQVASRLRRLAAAPVRRHPLVPLLSGAWRRRHNLRLLDALYVELANTLDTAILITTDTGLAATTPAAELITATG